MQLRLVSALVGIALVAVVLVGAGMLVLARLGARSQAEEKIAAQLGALPELLAGDFSPSELDRARAAFDLEALDLAIITTDGMTEVVELPPTCPTHDRASDLVPLFADLSDTPSTGDATGGSDGPSAAGPSTDSAAGFELASGEVDLLLSDEAVVLRDPAPSATVQAIRRLDTTPGSAGSLTVGLLATRRVDAVGTEALVWFVVSASAVLVASVIAACWLARRLTRPIRQIQAATAAIAAGDFDVRVDSSGTTELTELGHAVNSMARRLEQSRQLDQQFLMSVSHDLRTPLTAISGYAEALTDEAVFDTAHTGDVIRNHAYRLERLVGDLLDLARLDANRFEMQWQTVDVNVVVGRVVAGLDVDGNEVSLGLLREPAGPALVRADPDRLAQAVGNVIGYAVKFATSEVVTRVRVHQAHAYVEICDDGPGIPPHDLPFVFERLYVSSNQPARTGDSTGMGLAIVRELMAAMGGTVAADYRPGGGTRMTLRLPLLR